MNFALEVRVYILQKGGGRICFCFTFKGCRNKGRWKRQKYEGIGGRKDCSSLLQGFYDVFKGL